jgi:hypothetical protein
MRELEIALEWERRGQEDGVPWGDIRGTQITRWASS